MHTDAPVGNNLVQQLSVMCFHLVSLPSEMIILNRCDDDQGMYEDANTVGLPAAAPPRFMAYSLTPIE